MGTSTRVERRAEAQREAMDICREHKVDFRECMEVIIRNNEVKGFLIMDESKEEVIDRVWI